MYEEKPKHASGGPQPVFTVTNIKRTVEDLKKKKVKITQEPTDEDYGWIAEFRDPDGYCYELFQEKR